MTLKNSWLFALWIILIVSASCARQGTPTGGPKDTIPPTLVRMDPALGTVNFKGDELELEFSEFVDARDLKKELIINPTIKDFKFFVAKKTVVIRLEEKLKDSTTYTFNFREGIKDISEGNSAENIALAFSTGSYIDSFQVAGNVKRLLTNKPAKDVVVGLYATNDTLTISNSPPMYFTKTDEEGNYLINYIREGNYRVYAFDDQNNNLKFESNNEAIGLKAEAIALKADSVQASHALDSLGAKDSTENYRKLYGQVVNLSLFKEDVRPIQLQSSRPNGKYYEIKFNKPLKSFQLTTEESDITDNTKKYITDSLKATVKDSLPRYLYSNFQQQQQIIRMYNTVRQDSLRTFLTVADSANQQIEDTVIYIKFAGTKRKGEEFTQQFKPAQTEISQSIRGELSFSKPVIRINTDSILLAYDTLFTIPLDYEKIFSWNAHLDNLTISKEVNKEALIAQIITHKQKADSLAFEKKQQQEAQYLDSLKNSKSLTAQLGYLDILTGLQNNPSKKALADSIKRLESENEKSKLLANFIDTLTVTKKFIPTSYSQEAILANMKSLVLYMAPGSFMSVEQDSSKAVRQTFSFKRPEEYGTIKGKIDTAYPSYTIQLVDQEFNVISATSSHNSYAFQLIPPGTYSLRILIDQDEDGQWEEGNILENQEPEPVIFYENGEINLKANWEYTLDLTF